MAEKLSETGKNADSGKDGNLLGRCATSYDVAQLAGVSQSAVSRFFSPGSSLAPHTRAKIRKAVDELGYYPNAMASGLITRRSKLVAVLISNLTNLYYPELLVEITTQLSKQGIRVLLFALQGEADEETLEQIWPYRVDGAIVAVGLTRAQLDAFGRHGVPVVLYNRNPEGADVSSVGCDSVGGTRQLVDQLIDAGHRCFAFISGPEDSHVGHDRIEGTLQRLRELDLEPVTVRGNFDYASGWDGMRDLQGRGGPQIDALICANDLMAIGAIDYARSELDLRIPEDLSVVGFDGISPAAWANYRLATMRQPVPRMAAAAVSMILERIGAPALPPETRKFAATFVPGNSARLLGLREAAS